MVAIANIAQGIAPRGLAGVEAAAANAYIEKRQATVTSYDDGAAITTLLDAYLSANPSLQTANAEMISLASSFAAAQESYNAALSRGETPTPPVLAIPGQNGTTTLTGTGLGSGTTRPTAVTQTGAPIRPTITTSASTASPTGAAVHHANAKLAVVALCGLIAGLVILA